MISRGILDWCGVLCGEYERILRINYWGAFRKIAELFAVVGCYQVVWNTWGSCRMWESEELQNKTSLTTSGMNPDFPRNQLRSARERSRVVEFQLPLARSLPRDSPWRGWKIGAVGRGLPKKIVISCYFIRFCTNDIWWYVMIFVYFPHSCQAAQPSKIRLFSYWKSWVSGTPRSWEQHGWTISIAILHCNILQLMGGWGSSFPIVVDVCHLSSVLTGFGFAENLVTRLMVDILGVSFLDKPTWSPNRASPIRFKKGILRWFPC